MRWLPAVLLLACSSPEAPAPASEAPVGPAPGVLARDPSAARVRFSDDSRRLVALRHDGRLDVYDLADRATRTVGEGRFVAAAFTQGGARVVGVRANGTVQAYDASSGEAVGDLVRLTDAPRDAPLVALTRAGGHALFETARDGIVLVELATGRTLVRLPYEDRAHVARRLALAAGDGAAIVVTELGAVTQYDLRSPDRRTELPESPDVEALAAAPDGPRAVLVTPTGELRFVDLESARVTSTRGLGGEAPPRASAVAYTPDGCRLLVGDAQGGVRVYDVERDAFGEALEPHEDRVHALAVSPDGSLAASLSGAALRLHRLAPARCGRRARPPVALRAIADARPAPPPGHPVIAQLARGIFERWPAPATRARLDAIDARGTEGASGRALAYWLADRAVRGSAPGCLRTLDAEAARRLERLAPIVDRASALRAAEIAHEAGDARGASPGIATIRRGGARDASDAARFAACEDEVRFFSTLVPAILDHARSCAAGSAADHAFALYDGLIAHARASPPAPADPAGPCPDDARPVSDDFGDL